MTRFADLSVLEAEPSVQLRCAPRFQAPNLALKHRGQTGYSVATSQTHDRNCHGTAVRLAGTIGKETP